MREIKFRAWINIEEWQGYYCQGDSNEYIQFLLFQDGFSIVDYNDEYLKDSEFVIEQYTGLKDKNGVEIYEKDKLKCTLEDGRFFESVVSWSNGSLGFVLEGEACYGLCLRGMRNEDIEIIGNIHE